MESTTIKMGLADDLLTPLIEILVRLFGRPLSKLTECGFDCNVSELGFAEYFWLFIFFLVVVLISRKVITRIKRNEKKNT